MTSIQTPVQKNYHSKYSQNVDSKTFAQEGEYVRKYITGFINNTLRAMCPDSNTDNSILYGFNCYITKINHTANGNNKNIDIMVSPGVMISKSTLLHLNLPQKITINYNSVLSSSLDKILVCVKFVPNTETVANRWVQFDSVGNQIEPQLNEFGQFSFVIFFLDSSNQFLEEDTWSDIYTPIAIFQLVQDEDKLISLAAQLESVSIQATYIPKLIMDYDLNYIYNHNLIKDKVVNRKSMEFDSLVRLTLAGNQLIKIRRFLFGMRPYVNTLFNYEIAGRYCLDGLDVFTNFMERFYRL